MNAVWHLVRKDLRRMAVPVAVWNAFVVASNLWFRLATPALVGHVPSEVSIWKQELAITGALFVGIELALAYVLAGALVLEDRVVGSTQFWPTRPIRPLHLLLAKATCAAACFAVLPSLLLLPVWLSVAQTTEVATVATRYAMVHAGVALAGMAFASLVRSTAELIFVSIGALLLCFGGMWLRVVPPVWPVLLGLPTPATQFLVPALLVVFGAVTAVQYARRRARQSWVLLVVGLVACSSMGVRLSLAVISRVIAPPSATIPAAQLSVQVPRSFEADSRYRSWPRIVVTTPWQANQFLAAVVARNGDGNVVLGPELNWSRAVASLLVPSEVHPAVLRWPLTFTLQAPSRETDLTGALEIWKARAVVVGELPLVVGRRSASDAGVLRIASVEKLKGGDHEVWFEERTIETTSGWYPSSDVPIAWWTDGYFLVNRGESAVHWLWVSQPEAAWMNSQTVAFRRFSVSGPWDPQQLHLVKVRIIADQRFQIPISIHGVTDMAPRTSNADAAVKRIAP